MVSRCGTWYSTIRRSPNIHLLTFTDHHNHPPLPNIMKVRTDIYGLHRNSGNKNSVCYSLLFSLWKTLPSEWLCVCWSTHSLAARSAFTQHAPHTRYIIIVPHGLHYPYHSIECYRLDSNVTVSQASVDYCLFHKYNLSVCPLYCVLFLWNMCIFWENQETFLICYADYHAWNKTPFKWSGCAFIIFWGTISWNAFHGINFML